MKTPEEQLEIDLNEHIEKLHHSNFEVQKLTADQIIKIIDDYKYEKRYNPDLVFSLACRSFGFEPIDRKAVTRKRRVVEARQVAMYYFKKVANHDLALARIGGFFGKDHATVLHAIRTVKNLLETDIVFKTYYEIFLEETKKHSMYLCQDIT